MNSYQFLRVPSWGYACSLRAVVCRLRSLQGARSARILLRLGRSQESCRASEVSHADFLGLSLFCCIYQIFYQSVVIPSNSHKFLGMHFKLSLACQKGCCCQQRLKARVRLYCVCSIAFHANGSIGIPKNSSQFLGIRFF